MRTTYLSVRVLWQALLVITTGLLVHIQLANGNEEADLTLLRNHVRVPIDTNLDD